MSARILAIEDNPDNMELMAYLLQAFGHTVLMAYDGEQGVEAARRELPDLIICDIHLPRLDGYGVIREIKADPTLRPIPIVAVTALAMVGDREKILVAGFDGYIAKPIVPEAFVGQVEHFLRAAQRSAPGRQPAVTESAWAMPVQGSRGSILVVDDSPVNRELLRCILEPLGYQVSLAASVRNGLALARQVAFDLILCDVHLPDADGFDFLRMIKADPKLSAIPFIFLTSSVYGARDKTLALKQGAAQFIVRPIEPLALLAEIEAVLQKEQRQ